MRACNEVTQMPERLGKIPTLQRRRLIERVWLRLDQRRIMQRVEDEGARTIGTLMAGDLFATAQV
jgi:hypothetical protein